MLKEDPAGGKLPSGRFGVNAAWWAIALLAFNLNSALKRLVLGKEWVRLKAVRFAFISLPGRVVRWSRALIIRLAGEHPAYPLLLLARQRVLALALAQGPVPGPHFCRLGWLTEAARSGHAFLLAETSWKGDLKRQGTDKTPGPKAGTVVDTFSFRRRRPLQGTFSTALALGDGFGFLSPIAIHNSFIIMTSGTQLHIDYDYSLSMKFEYVLTLTRIIGSRLIIAFSKGQQMTQKWGTE